MPKLCRTTRVHEVRAAIFFLNEGSRNLRPILNSPSGATHILARASRGAQRASYERTTCLGLEVLVFDIEVRAVASAAPHSSGRCPDSISDEVSDRLA